MTTYARKVNNVAVDVCTTNPAASFHADVAAQFITVPDGTLNGATFAAGAWTNPAPPAPTPAPPEPYPVLTPMQFFCAFNVKEAHDIETSADPYVAQFYKRLMLAIQTNTPVDPNLVSVSGGVHYLAIPETETTPLGTPGPGILAPERVAQVLQGIPQ